MKLQLTSFAWEKILAYTDLCPDEISGLGKIEIINDNFVATDVAIFDQKVSGAHSTIEAKALAKFHDEKVKKGESMKAWVLWWHSHANMGVFFSGTDTGTIDSSTDFPYMVSLVVNKKHEREARFDLFKPVRFKQEKLDIEILQVANDKLKKQCQKDIAKYVTSIREEVKRYPTSYPHGYKTSEPKWVSPKTYTPTLIQWDSKEYLDQVQEYHEHRKWLVEQVNKSKTIKSKREYQKAQRELSEWDMWAEQLKLNVEMGE